MSSFDLDAGVQESSGTLKSRWPRAWRPYAALLSGFCGMANCWYTSQHPHDIICAEISRPDNADGRAPRGLIMSFGTFFRYYDEDLLLAATDTTIGLIGGIQAFIVLLLSIIVGRLLDAKFHRLVVAVGGILTWLGHFCLSFNSMQGSQGQGSYGLIILTQSVVAGIGMSCFFTHSSHCAIQVRKSSSRPYSRG